MAAATAVPTGSAVPDDQDDHPEGTRRRGATKRQRSQLAGLADRLAPCTGRQPLAAEAMREAAELIAADTVALVVRSIHGPRILAQHPGGADAPELWGVRTLAALLARPEPVRLAISGDPLTEGGRTALVTAPVPAAGGAVGVVVARRHSGKAFVAADEDALSRLARVCGALLHRTAERTAVAASAVDPATRLGSHDLLLADLAQTLQAIPVHGMPTTLVVAEVVGLSRLRTAETMAAADAAIADVAVRIGSRLRVGDLLYRTSADELAVLLPATDAEGGAAVARRLAEEVLPVETDRSDEADPAGAAPAVHGLSLRTVAVPVEEPAETIMLGVIRRLAAARVNERWAAPDGTFRAGAEGAEA